MAITFVPVTHTFLNGDGSPASGSVTAILDKSVTNGSTSVMPTEVTAQINGSTGAMSLRLAATDDPGTSPPDARWKVTLRVAGTDAVTYSIQVPAADASGVDLGVLLPRARQVG